MDVLPWSTCPIIVTTGALSIAFDNSSSEWDVTNKSSTTSSYFFNSTSYSPAINSMTSHSSLWFTVAKIPICKHLPITSLVDTSKTLAISSILAYSASSIDLFWSPSSSPTSFFDFLYDFFLGLASIEARVFFNLLTAELSFFSSSLCFLACFLSSFFSGSRKEIFLNFFFGFFSTGASFFASVFLLSFLSLVGSSAFFFSDLRWSSTDIILNFLTDLVFITTFESWISFLTCSFLSLSADWRSFANSV